MDAIADAQLEIRKMKEEIAEKEEAKALAQEKKPTKNIAEVNKDIKEKTEQVALTEFRIDQRLKDRKVERQDFSKPFD